MLQIETNRNTALTLACFQGRHEVVGLLCQRGANVEHRAKVGGGRGWVVSRLTLEWLTGIGVLPILCTYVRMCVSPCGSVLVCCVSPQTGLTPLMEAASGGYHEVGRILVEHVSVHRELVSWSWEEAT